MDKNRISVYITDKIKNEWIRFAKGNNYSTLSKFMREAIEFYIKYKSKSNINDKIVDIDLLSNLSHELKEPLTSLKAYLQLIVEEHSSSLGDDVKKMVRIAFEQCLILEKKIVENLESFEMRKGGEIIDNNLEYDILIIEDNVETVRFLTVYFTKKGYSSRGVYRGRNGLEELKNHQPKLIILDIILPDISGYEVYKIIKTINTLKDVPIFFLTALPKSEVEIETQTLKPTGTIFKPFSLTDFEAIYEYLK
ncbi:hypothetical protein LCGC14_1109690 [marine sediment metagenome]|uniref:Response regulatory domain-containing protein n=1 Tax=marine sediment metagenome TaxID=412755 RepID=A0A0F9MV15_9ZZZZ